jgi:hypothetical protein
MKTSFWQVEIRLLVGATIVGLVVALVEDRFTVGGVAASLGLACVVALGIGAVYCRRTIGVIVILAIVVVLAFVVARLVE